MSNYPDNFDSRAFDDYWGGEADGTVAALEAQKAIVSDILKDEAFDDIRNTLLDAYDDAIGEIQRADA